MLKAGRVITGDGRADLADTVVVVEDGRIADLLPAGAAPMEGSAKVLDLGDACLLPGIINPHAHGVTLGPLFASAAPPLAEEQIKANLDAHLLAGTTTLLNLDGFALPEEVEVLARRHPINLKTATAHTPLHFRAADAADGRGLTPRHRAMAVEAMLAAGAVAVGEVGSGHTLGGGGQEYMYIPAAVRTVTGREIGPITARALKEAVLGRFINPGAGAVDRQALAAVLTREGLADVLSLEEAARLVRDSVLPSIQPARKAVGEAVALAARLGVPVSVHTSAPSRAVIREAARMWGSGRAGDSPWGGGAVPTRGRPAAGFRLIAGHANHDTFTVEEAVVFARELRDLGAVIEVSTFDAFGARKTTESPDHFMAMLAEGVVDTLSTDYGGGFSDPVLRGVAEAVAAGIVSLPKAVAMATSRVADAFRRLAPGRGRIARGLAADLVWTDPNNVARVKGVMVSGEVVVKDRWVIY